jgi:parallel beta-helix repeat protein
MRILTKLALMVTAIFLCIFYSAQQVSARTISLKCNTGQPLQTILDTANDGDIIRVSGTCNANVVIDKNRIRLEAVGGATLNGPNVSAPTISVKGLNVEIQGFASISGGRSAIRVESGGSAVIKQNTLKNSLRGILVIQSSYASIFNNTIENNVGNTISSIGIEVRQSSAADIISNTIKNNQASGIVISDGSAADIDENDIVDNGGDGILIQRTSHARLAGDPASGVENFIQGNNRGVACNQNSSLRSDGPQDFGTGNTNGNTTGITGGCTVSGTVE